MAKNSLSEQFSLRWNNFSNNLTSGFLNHLTENDLVDVTLAVEGQLLQAHKLVLSVCSPYFKNIFKVYKYYFSYLKYISINSNCSEKNFLELLCRKILVNIQSLSSKI